jgi:hypothetical protein
MESIRRPNIKKINNKYETNEKAASLIPSTIYNQNLDPETEGGLD